MQQSTTPTPSCPNSFTFRVIGTPVPQGSMKAYNSRVIANNHDELMSWRQDVALTAFRHKPENWDINKPVSLRCEFVFPRPKSHYGTGKNSDKLKDSAPTHHITTPDLDKLIRSIGDSISVGQVLLRNDSLISSVYAVKRYALDDFLGAIITITAIDD
jgi:Holliday junction resolvase RusA-like endonuclease